MDDISPERVAEFDGTRAVLDDAVRRGAFPCAVAEVGTPDGSVFTHATGSPWPGKSPAAASPLTVFDLASLTKVLATTTIALLASAESPGLLESPVAAFVPEWRGLDREHVTVEDLLAHQSGLTAHLPLFRDCGDRDEFRHAIATGALEYRPRAQSIYSDLGFILLGFILEEVGGVRLDGLFESLRVEHALGELTFSPPSKWRDRLAPTGTSEWRRRVLLGEVNDENCWGLGGVAGHAGLFGTAAAVGKVARAWLATLASTADGPLGDPSLARRFASRVDIPGSSRALGWDTMLPTSSCGPQLSRTSIGHTGFTGTSLWLDLEQQTYFVLLTNRVHPDATNDEILRVRPAFHSAAAQAVDHLRR